MSHSHMPVQHLIKQVELYKSRKNQRDVRPEWISELIEQVAELFEPLSEDGRVGFDCQFHEDQWIVGLYLGSTEYVGGPRDGQIRFQNFQFDLHTLLDYFESVETFYWNAIPDPLSEDETKSRSCISISGNVMSHQIRLHIFSIPPKDASPGFREYLDGRCEPL
ncbi:MAG: hypothetical protein Tsb009_36080 [Planctomycetaceae bacterium]